MIPDKNKIILWVILILTVIGVSILLYYLITNKSSSSEYYGPDNIFTYGQKNSDLFNLTARVYDLNQVMSKMPLGQAIQRLGPDQRVGVFSIDNDKKYRKAIESNESYRKILAPAVDKKLREQGRGKLARNVLNNNLIITEPVSMNGYVYPVGQWLFVQRMDNIA